MKYVGNHRGDTHFALRLIFNDDDGAARGQGATGGYGWQLLIKVCEHRRAVAYHHRGCYQCGNNLYG